MMNVRKIVLCTMLASILMPAVLLMPTAVGQPWQPGSSPEFRAWAQRVDKENQQKAIFVGVCVAVGIFCLIMGFYAYTKERDKKEREWRERQDEKNREFLAQKLQENRDSDPPNK